LWIVAIIAVAAVAAALRPWWSASADGVARAKAAYKRGDWGRAAEVLRGELKPSSGLDADPEALRIYARALARLERDEAAKAIYGRRLGDAVLEPEDRFLIGLTYIRAGQLEAAREVWQTAAQQGPDHAELLDHLGRLSFRLQRMDQSAAAARRLGRQPGWEARGLFLLGQIQSVIDNPAGAVDALQAALQRDPSAQGAPFDPPFYRKALARNLLRLGRAAEAQEQLAVLLPQPDAPKAGGDGDREADWLLSRAHLQQGRIPDASNALARAGSYGAENRLMPEPSPYVGSAACARCHAEISRTYDGTRHTRSFHHDRGLLELPLPDRSLTDPDDPKVSHTIERRDGQIEVRTQVGDRVFRMVVAYAFGTRGRYVTMIGRDEEKDYRAVRLSFYHTADGSGWGRTAGDVGRSEAIEDVRGQKVDVRDGVVRCLYCHVTQSRDFRDPPPEGKPGPEARDAGIGCERCHGPGGNHVRAIETDFADRAIINVAGAPADTVNTQCAECHIVGSRPEIEAAPDDPRFVRSPGLTLTFSRCSTAGGGLSCVTCHDPHREAEHAPSSYEAKCLACHSRQAGPPVAGRPGDEEPATATGRRTSCPVNPTRDCLGCHMPKVPMPDLHTSLTDHFIRVHKR
jgi:tetratricopeptide (TPR) repeat protein